MKKFKIGNYGVTIRREPPPFNSRMSMKEYAESLARCKHYEKRRKDLTPLRIAFASIFGTMALCGLVWGVAVACVLAGGGKGVCGL